LRISAKHTFSQSSSNILIQTVAEFLKRLKDEHVWSTEEINKMVTLEMFC